MAYVKTVWIDKNAIDFDLLTSPEIDADNLNKIENGIYNTDSALDALSTAYGSFSVEVKQTFGSGVYDLVWVIQNDSNDTDIFTLDDTANTVTIKKPGNYTFKTITNYSSMSSDSRIVTTQIVDAFLGTVWQETNTTLSLGIGGTQSVSENKKLSFISSDLPKTLKFIVSVNGVGISIDTADYTLNTLSGGIISGDHADITGRDAEDSHPIAAITDLTTTITGEVLTGESA